MTTYNPRAKRGEPDYRPGPDWPPSLDELRVEYLSSIPVEVPAGRVVVHNNVRPTRRMGSRGFRAWLIEPSERLVVCGCDWAPELDEHYRVESFRHGLGTRPKRPESDSA